MDIPALQDAVEEFMLAVLRELKAIKPDILLEFRQEYVGPHMKRFGNMFRVGDCGGDYLRNRVGVLDLRMTMGNQAVHSDMLALPVSETPEHNALQIVSAMFGVLQYSGRLEYQSAETKEMAKFWVKFLKDHKQLLQEGNLQTYESHLLYTWAKSTLDNECAVGVYGLNTCVAPDPVDTVYIANGCAVERVLLELNGKYSVQVLDCRGTETAVFEKEFSGINTLSIPVGGIAVLHR
jgi:alpha-galactosidase